ncbi:MAG: hypothetical protein HY855_25100 [Burkholderiales bacterium]|nr:hypothetical protein [Burkholderiales bacterium]
MSTLATLTPIEHALVSRHLQRLRAIASAVVRRDYLESVGRTDGKDMRDLVEKCFSEEWTARRGQKGKP